MAPTAARARRLARATPTITEPAFPAWAAVAAILTLGAFIAVLPGGPASAAAAAPPPSPPSWSATLHAVRPLVAADLAAAACIFAFLKAGEAYGRARHGGRTTPYPGPWRVALPGSVAAATPPATASPSSTPPRCFAPAYLLFAATVAFLVPASALVGSCFRGGGGGGPGGPPPPAVAAALAPYLALFVFQYACETAWLRRSILAPTIPLAFMVVRPWQLARSLALVGGGVGGGGSPPHPSITVLLQALALFWTFDTAALLAWLPWTYNLHLLGAEGRRQ
jgi:hypothetical protein